MIKAIETEYNGYKFRSRLEARWAVFFDALGVFYEYEPEGFQIDESTYYLPDFYIPEWGIYVEVKTNRPGAADEIRKTVKFANNTTNVVLILSDIPDGKEGIYWFPALWFNPLETSVNANWIGISFFDKANLIRDFTTSKETHPLYNLQIDEILKKQAGELFKYEPNSKMNWEHWEPRYSLFDIKENKEPHIADLISLEYDIDDREKLPLQKAYRKARQARFEHGEKPII